MEVFAVVIVYCKAPIEAKIPLLFDLSVVVLPDSREHTRTHT